jgi:hypothetical protein
MSEELDKAKASKVEEIGADQDGGMGRIPQVLYHHGMPRLGAATLQYSAH